MILEFEQAACLSLKSESELKVSLHRALAGIPAQMLPSKHTHEITCIGGGDGFALLPPANGCDPNGIELRRSAPSSRTTLFHCHSSPNPLSFIGSRMGCIFWIAERIPVTYIET